MRLIENILENDPEKTPENSVSELRGGGITMILQEIFDRYGYDFRDYARPSLERRIRAFMKEEGFSSVAYMGERMLGDAEMMQRFIRNMSVNVTSMFRDPGLYAVIRSEIIPVLRTFPFIRIWHAGCSTGEEAYSMAILMKEAGLYDRCRIYATDMDEACISKAKAGIFPLQAMRKFTSNYIAAGGSEAFSEYYTAKDNHAIINSSLRKNIIFAQHNLVSDGSFNEFHIILCRNVLIYFNEKLQARVHRLFHQSLAMFGYLGLGSKEGMALSGVGEAYSNIANIAGIDAHHKLYRKIA